MLIELFISLITQKIFYTFILVDAYQTVINYALYTTLHDSY